MLEAIIVILILASGSLLLRTVGLKGWPLLPLGFLTGLTGVVLLGYIQAFLGFQSSWVYPLGLLVAISVVFYIYRWSKGSDVHINPAYSIISILAIASLVLFTSEANLIKYHFDSVRYLIAGSLLYTGNIESISMNLLTKRFSSVSLLHSLGHLFGDFYLRSLTPLISLSALSTLYWFVREAFKSQLSKKLILTIFSITLLLLVTSHGFVWHSFYLNGHLLFGSYMLLLVGSGWLYASRRLDIEPTVLTTLMAVATLGLVLTRPEGMLFAAFALLPIVLSDKIRLRHRAVVLASYGTAVMIKQGFIIYTMLGMGRGLGDIGSNTYGLFAIGVAAFIAIPFLIFQYTEKRQKALLLTAETSLWIMLAYFTVRNPWGLISSLSSTADNLIFGAGNWGLSVVSVGIIFIITMAFYRFPAQIYIRFAATTFVPLSLLMAYLVGGSYRTGVTDTLNRMIMQVLIIIILFIAIAIGNQLLQSKKSDK